MFIFNFLSFIEYSLSTSPACTYMYNRPFNLLPPPTTPPSQSRVICVYSELNEIIIAAGFGGGEKEEELKVWGAFINQLTHHL